MVFRGSCSAADEQPEVSGQLQDKERGEGVPVGDHYTVTAGLEGIDQRIGHHHGHVHGGQMVGGLRARKASEVNHPRA